MKSNQQTLCPMVGGLMELNKGKRISGGNRFVERLDFYDLATNTFFLGASKYNS